jgi:hypothetical protein
VENSVLKSNESRVVNKLTNFRLERAGVICYLIYTILNFIIIRIGFLKPNTVLYIPSYLDTLTANYLYPWIVLSNEYYSNVSLVLGIVAITAEIAAVILFVIKLPQNDLEIIDRAKIIMKVVLVVTTVLKYLCIYLSCFLFLEWGHYDYPDNIFWSFYDGGGLALISITLIVFFLIQGAVMIVLIFSNYVHLEVQSNAVPKTKNNYLSLIFPILTMLLLGEQKHLFKNQSFFQILFGLRNVAPALDMQEGYIPLLVFNLIASSIIIILLVVNLVVLQLAIRRNK